MTQESDTPINSQRVVGKPVGTKRGNKITFDNCHGTIPPKQRISITLTCDCINQESIEEYFEIMIKDAKSLFFQLLGEIQQPRVYLNRDTVELGRIYAGIREVVEADSGKHKSQSLELVNYGNLPVYFKWEELNDSTTAVARFEPKKGMIPPKQKRKIAFEITVYKGGSIDELLMCDI